MYALTIAHSLYAAVHGVKAKRFLVLVNNEENRTLSQSFLEVPNACAVCIVQRYLLVLHLFPAIFNNYFTCTQPICSFFIYLERLLLKIQTVRFQRYILCISVSF